MGAGLPSDSLGKGPAQDGHGGEVWTARPGVTAGTTHTQASEKHSSRVGGQSPASEQGCGRQVWESGIHPEGPGHPQRGKEQSRVNGSLRRE